jgi:predicted CopG family antitoxin
MGYNTINFTLTVSPTVLPLKDSNQKPVKYRTIRVREEVAQQLDEWRDLFEDASVSEVMWRVFALARRELKRVRDKKRKAHDRFVTERKPAEKLVDLVDKPGVE